MSAHCAAERRPQGTIRQRRIFGIGDASPRCRRRLGCASRAQARGGSLLLTFQIGRRGSRHRRPLPDRPPTLQAFRSALSETTSVSTQRLSRLPFVPPSPWSSIPESTNMIPYQRVIRQSARSEISCLSVKRHLRFWSRLDA